MSYDQAMIQRDKKPLGARAASVSPTAFQRACMKLVFAFLGRLRRGCLEVHLPDGTRQVFGNTDAEQRSRVTIHSHDFFRRVALGSDIGLGESYMAGEWEADDLTRCLRLFVDNMDVANDRGIWSARLMRLADRLRHWLRANNLTGSRKNIQYHYDLGNAFYELFLDETLTYSSACFRSPEETLREGQMNKIRMLIDKAQLGPQDHLLEIGSGWGTLAIEAVKSTGCRVTTITLSDEQFSKVQERVKAEGLQDRIHPILCDYRRVEGRFDKIISVEMLEAVGHEYLGEYFRTVDRLLAPNGIAAIQVITIPDQRYDDYRRSTDWIQKYIFPGAVVPSLTALTEAMTRDSQLVVEHVENIGIHYARTLREWRGRFNARLDEVKAQGFDDRFCRMWDYYLCYCEAGFEARILNDLHLVLSRPGNVALRQYR